MMMNINIYCTCTYMYLEGASLSVGGARDVVCCDELCGPEWYFAAVVVEQGVGGVRVGRVGRLRAAIPRRGQISPTCIYTVSDNSVWIIIEHLQAEISNLQGTSQPRLVWFPDPSDAHLGTRLNHALLPFWCTN